MNEHEVDNAIDAAFFMANEVVNEYHSFPVVNRADVGWSNSLFILLNGNWYRLDVSKVTNPVTLQKLEALA